VLFEGGAGEMVRRRLLQECDIHTLPQPAHRSVLCAGDEGQRPVLRTETCPGDSMDGEAMDL